MGATPADNAAATATSGGPPTARYYLVDHTGTHRLDAQQGAILFDAPPGLDLYFADLTYEPA